LSHRVGARLNYLARVRYVFRGCSVLIDERDRYVETRFLDDSKVGSTPNVDRHSLLVAAELGYDDTWSMSRDHELAHSWLAHMEGLACSPTMWRLAHPERSDVLSDTEVAEEEARVLSFQRSLDKVAPRPWDMGEIPSDHGLPWGDESQPPGADRRSIG